MSKFKHCLINKQSGFSFNLWTWQASKLKSTIVRYQTTTVPVQCNPSKLHHKHLNHLVDWLLFLLLDSYKNIENYYFTHYLVNNFIFIQKWQIIFNSHESRNLCRKSNEIQLLLYKYGKWCASKHIYA